MSVGGMGSMEILIVLLIAFIFLGPQRMVEAARFLGKAVKEVRRMSAELGDLGDLGLDEDENNPASAPANAQANRGGGANPNESDAVKKASSGREQTGATVSGRPSNTPSSSETDEPGVDSDGPVAFRPPGAAATDDDAMTPPQREQP